MVVPILMAATGLLAPASAVGMEPPGQVPGTVAFAGRLESGRIAEAALSLAPQPISRRARREALARIDALAGQVRAELPGIPSARRTLEAINHVLFQREGFRGTMAVDDPESLSLAALVKNKRGTCVSLVILYLAVAERVGLKAAAAATPVHLFVRHEGVEGVFNVETLEQGRFLDDDAYRSRHRMAESSIEGGVFLRPLPERALLAHFLNNRGVLAAAAGRRRAALRDFRRALELFPDLAAAHYNRGLERLKAGQFTEAAADLTRAIEIHPLDAQAFNNRGIARQRLGDVESAKRDFVEALRIDPRLGDAAHNLRLLERAASPPP